MGQGCLPRPHRVSLIRQAPTQMEAAVAHLSARVRAAAAPTAQAWRSVAAETAPHLRPLAAVIGSAGKYGAAEIALDDAAESDDLMVVEALPEVDVVAGEAVHLDAVARLVRAMLRDGAHGDHRSEGIRTRSVIVADGA
jgi:hypothetical protein